MRFFPLDHFFSHPWVSPDTKKEEEAEKEEEDED
jgi:hypothetical protein